MENLYTFIETPIFSKQIDKMRDKGLLLAIQEELANNPECGTLIKGGMRKVRIASPARREGKRGGYRSWFFFHRGKDTFYLLFLLDKKEAGNLSHDQENIVEQDLREVLRHL